MKFVQMGTSPADIYIHFTLQDKVIGLLMQLIHKSHNHAFMFSYLSLSLARMKEAADA